MRIFLDTTVLIDAIFNVRSEKEKIMDILKENTVITSSFAIGELKTNILKQCCDVYNNLSYERNIFESILMSSKNVWKTSWYNRLIKIFLYLGDNDVEDEILDYKENLQLLIDSFLNRTTFYIDEIIQGDEFINCAKSALNIKPNFNLETQKYIFDTDCVCYSQGGPNCNLERFLRLNENTLNKIKTSPKEISGMQKTHTETLLKYKTIYGKNCWYTGDSLLCVEFPEDAYMFSTDKTIHRICKLLEKKLLEQDTDFV